MLNIPFWSLLKGSFGRSAGDANIPLNEELHRTTATKMNLIADPICPFSSFEVLYVEFPYVEADYTTRINAEVAYYGESIPLEADILVDFTEIPGVSVLVTSFIEVEHDQTVIRKTIEIETFLPEPSLIAMYQTQLLSESTDEMLLQENIQVFTMTIRPSILNLLCDNHLYFKTIQINLGCTPLSKMRLIAEAVPLRKIDVVPWNSDVQITELETKWHYNESDGKTGGISYLILPRQSVHKQQYDAFNCSNSEICKVPIPAGRNIQDNVYGLSFRDILVPKFEQFLTQHTRRVTGNIIMYDILDSYKVHGFNMETNTTQYNVRCIVDDGDWYAKLSKESNFFKKELPLQANIYRHFNNCHDRRILFNNNLQSRLPTVPIQELNDRKYFVFNRTNRNALRLKRRRNYIYIVRAVVVNTEYNGFTYCRNLDTFFVLQVVNIIQQKKEVEWYLKYFYICIILLLLFAFLLLYIYFARTFHWTVDLEPDKTVHDEKMEDIIVEELHKKYSRKDNPFQRLAQQIQDLQKVRQGARDYHLSRIAEREERLGSSKRAKSESAKDERRQSLETIREEQYPQEII